MIVSSTPTSSDTASSHHTDQMKPYEITIGPTPPQPQNHKSFLGEFLHNIPDKDRLWLIEQTLMSVEFTGTIHQIRELVNDPKWDDKV